MPHLPSSRARRAVLASLAALAAPIRPAAAQAPFPIKPVRLVVAYAPGGANDLTARLVAQKMSESLGQGVVVENRAGASGIIGTDAVAKAAPDGHTLLLGAGGTMTINPSLFKTLPYDPLRDFAPIGLAATSPLVLVVPASSPARTVQELVGLAKSRPDGLSFASPGAGTPLHLAGELFQRAAGLTMTHVPYKGSVPALNDLVAGRIDLMFDVLGSATPFIRSNRLRALAVTSAQRSALMPELPTLAESGVAGFDVTSWFGLFAPADTPRDVVARLNAELNRAVSSADARDRLAPIGMSPAGGTPEQLRALVQSEGQRWAKLVREANLRQE